MTIGRRWSNHSDPISFPRVTIGSIPDNVLLEIFDFCQITPYRSPRWWIALVHACRRWRYIVFESPLRLDLRLVCDANTPVKEMLDVWPHAFPIIIKESRSRHPLSGANVIAALEHHDRVSKIYLTVTSTLSKQLHKVTKKPYPVLTHLCLHIGKSAPVLRDSIRKTSNLLNVLKVWLVCLMLSLSRLSKH
jgi:F-box-like